MTVDIRRGASTVKTAHLVAATLPGTVMLVGSLARGETHEESDIDLICIVDESCDPDRMLDEKMSDKAEAMVGLRVDVLKVDWPTWIEQTKVSTSLLGSCLRDGVMLKWERPRTTSPWRPIKTEREVRLSLIESTIGSIGADADWCGEWGPPTVWHMGGKEGERQSLEAGDPDNFWKYWNRRVSGFAGQYRSMFESSLILLCHVTATPTKRGGKMLELLDDYPREVGATLEELWQNEDMEWLAKWHSAGYWQPGHPHKPGECSDYERSSETRKLKGTPLGHARTTGVPYDQGLARYMRLCSDLALKSIAFALREYPARIFEDPGIVGYARRELRGLINYLGQFTGEFLLWPMYPHGVPPDHWKRPWE